MPQTAVTLRGQVPAGGQYPGQHAGMYGLQLHHGQHLLVGSSEVEPVQRDPRKCTKTRVVDDKVQHCNGWAVKGREPKLCMGHHRELERFEQELKDGAEPTADEGLHPSSS